MKTIGIDIGGSKIRAVLWDLPAQAGGGRVLAARQVKTPKKLGEFSKEILKLITWQPGCQVGIGAAGIISGTKIVFSPNIKYLRNFDFNNLLTPDVNRLPVGIERLKIKLDNDARCFARAVIGGPARNAAHSAAGGANGTILAVTLGTGIGRALIKNGKVQKIKSFEYPEKWERKYQRLMGKPGNHARDEKLVGYLSEKIIKLARPFSPNTIVFGGGVMERKGFFGKLRKEFRQLARLNDGVGQGWKGNIHIARHGKNAVAIGAASLLM